MQLLDLQAYPYIESLVATLKQTKTFSSPLIEAAFKQVPRHCFIDHFYRREKKNNKVQLQEIRLILIKHQILRGSSTHLRNEY